MASRARLMPRYGTGAWHVDKRRCRRCLHVDWWSAPLVRTVWAYHPGRYLIRAWRSRSFRLVPPALISPRKPDSAASGFRTLAPYPHWPRDALEGAGLAGRRDVFTLNTGCCSPRESRSRDQHLSRLSVGFGKTAGCRVDRMTAQWRPGGYRALFERAHCVFCILVRACPGLAVERRVARRVGCC